MSGSGGFENSKLDIKQLLLLLGKHEFLLYSVGVIFFVCSLVAASRVSIDTSNLSEFSEK